MIFIDETGAKTNMTRLYGRSLKGARCLDHAPDGRWERITILSALRHDGQTCSVIFDGALNGKIYDEYIEKFLAPTLNQGLQPIACKISSCTFFLYHLNLIHLSAYHQKREPEFPSVLLLYRLSWIRGVKNRAGGRAGMQ